MAKKILKFPEGFLWGAATSAHQVEGGNVNDWSEWEKKNAQRLASVAGDKWEKRKTGLPASKFPEMFESDSYISGRACDHYNRYEEDFDIAKTLGLNAFRISIEWSRIEPEEGKFDEREIEHYREVIKVLRDRGMEPFVTLWHWTIPLWLEKKGGCHSNYFPGHFANYAKHIAERFQDDVNYWITLNEPTSVITNSYLKGIWPPQKRNFYHALEVYKILADAHKQAYVKIKSLNNKCNVGLANILHFIEPSDGKNVLDRLVAKISDYYANKKFYNLTKNKHDFLAVQYYFHEKIKFPWKIKNENKEITDMGWEIYPEGIYHVLKDLRKYNLPIYITENGLADAEDKKRARFIKDHLRWVHKAISEGVDVCGYFYWSLLDNFEWDKGFWPRFGLLEMDYKTMERKIRPSAFEYAKICKENAIIP